MVIESANVKEKTSNKGYLFFTTTLGVCCVLIPVTFLFIDPVLMAATYYLRVGNGTYVQELMLTKLEGPRIYVSLFNFTNAKEYAAGKAEKIKIEEVGPFVFQEYRINQDLIIDEEAKRMVYAPRVWAEFVPEESVADPKEVIVLMPNMAMLQGATMMSKYSFLRNIFNVITSSTKSKAFVNITAYDILWGYPDPLIKLVNTFIPGLFYYNSSGILDRVYDVGAKYTMELGIKDEEKFGVKKVTKFHKLDSQDIPDSVQNFTNTYEGSVFPPGMTRDTTINIYRYSICKVLRLKLTGSKTTEYGSEAFTYDIANETFNDRELCLNNGKWCPGGIMNLAPCIFNLPIAMSRSHFLGGDPRIIERYEGIKPDRKLHATAIVIDPKIGVTISSNVSIQLNLVLGDIGYNTETAPFKDTVVPVCHCVLRHPKLPSVATTAFKVIYTYGPYIRLAITLACLLTGLALLVYSAKKFYLSNEFKRTSVLHEKEITNNSADSYFPLIKQIN